MKRNWKNRPKPNTSLITCMSAGALIAQEEAREKWDQGFEKELREWLKENERYRPNDDFEVKRIKEILGDKVNQK